jgi:bifunctional DNase/RNase
MNRRFQIPVTRDLGDNVTLLLSYASGMMKPFAPIVFEKISIYLQKNFMDNSTREFKIFSLMLIPMPAQYVIYLEEVDGTRLIPIWIGVNEGNAIVYKLQDEAPPRPMTHDLLANILKTLDMSIEKITVSDLKDNTYYAVIDMWNGKKNYSIDSRPSDAIALAVRTDSPIYVSQTVMEKCPVIRKPISDDEVDKFKNELQQLRPEDFFKDSGDS